jgi:hypothetical protein
MTDGPNVTDTVQFDPAISWLGQLSVSENPPVPEILNGLPTKLSGLPPKLAIVMGWEALVPTFWDTFSVAGEKLMAEGRGVGSGTGVAPKT